MDIDSQAEHRSFTSLSQKLMRGPHNETTGKASVEPVPANDRPPFTIGVGSSAGGIEALLEFVKKIPQDSELAYILVQHMSPDFKTMLPEILTRQTGNQVTIAKEGMVVKKGGIYLNPPDKMLTLFHGRLLLEDRVESDPASFYPIDHFFNTLAEEAGPHAIGVILSGTGSDGTKGAQEIKRRSGYVVVLSPDTAKFAGMSKNAINSADAILPLTEIPTHIAEYSFGIGGDAARSQIVHNPSTNPALDKAFLHLRNHFGIDFSSYKEDLILRRIARRAKIVGCEGTDEYCDHLGRNKKELCSLYDDLLLGVTEFNRHPESLESLKNSVIKKLVESEKDIIRVWVVGCSTGEEPFTIAFLLNDAISKAKAVVDFKIFATDVDDKALRIASRASYPLDRVKDLPEKWKEKYFNEKDGQAYIKPDIRERVVFANHNIIKDAPFPSVDLITCRNLLIYLKKEAKKHVHQAFQFSLKNKGYLLLSPNEGLLNDNKDFETLDEEAKIFQCTNSGRSHSKKAVAATTFRVPPKKLLRRPTKATSLIKASLKDDYESKLHAKLACEHLPGSLVFGKDGVIDYFFGDIRDYLAPINGKASILLEDVLPEELKNVVMSLLNKLDQDGGQNSDMLILKKAENAGLILEVDLVDLAIEKEGVRQFLVKFRSKELETTYDELKKAIPSALHAKLARLDADSRVLRRELLDNKSEMVSIVGQLEASNEELRATNEELQAGSEELQSTNEELQAVNEELYTVNAECQMRITELSEMSSDVQNIYEVSEIGTLFVDKELRIRKFNAHSQKLFNLLPDDIGRPIENFSSALKVDFAKKAKKVIKEVKIFEKEIKSRDNMTYLMRVAPYRTDDLEVRGAVLVFIDISALKKTQTKLTDASNDLKMVSQETSDLIVKIDPKGRLLSVNESFCRHFSEKGFDASELKNFTDFVHPDSQQETSEKIEILRSNKTKEENLEFKHVTEDGETIAVAWHIKAKFDQRGTLKQFVSIGRIT